MSSDNLPWEDEWGLPEWLEWCPNADHVSSVRWGQYRCVFGHSPDSTAGLSTCSRDDAAREHARLYCAYANTPLPFRPRPDLRTVEACIRAITEAGGEVAFRGGDYGPVSVWNCAEELRCVGFGQPWTLIHVQAAARYVLGIPEQEEAATDE